MSTDFNWWLLVVGVVVGGALTWLVLADSRRREDELAEEELTAEAGWIARMLNDPRWTRTRWSGCSARTAATWASRPRTRSWTRRASRRWSRSTRPAAIPTPSGDRAGCPAAARPGAPEAAQSAQRLPVRTGSRARRPRRHERHAERRRRAAGRRGRRPGPPRPGGRRPAYILPIRRRSPFASTQQPYSSPRRERREAGGDHRPARRSTARTARRRPTRRRRRSRRARRARVSGCGLEAEGRLAWSAGGRRPRALRSSAGLRTVATAKPRPTARISAAAIPATATHGRRAAAGRTGAERGARPRGAGGR